MTSITTRAPLRITAGLLALGGLVSCTSEVVDDSGATATGTTTATGTATGAATGTATGTGTGTPAGTTPPACPATKPTHDDDCDAAMTCSYPDATCPGLEVTAECFAMEWKVATALSCGPLTSPTCDPVGTWLVTHDDDWDPLPPFDGPPADGYELPIWQAADGSLLVVASDAQLSADGCELELTTMLDGGWYEDEWGTYGEWYYRHLQLTIVGDMATGTTTVWCEGECGGSATATAHATRLSP